VAGNNVTFSDLSTISSGSIQRLWELGESDTSTLNNLAKGYSSPGLYSIKLVQESALGCKDSLSKTVLINPQPVVDFTIGNDSQCVNGNSFVLNDISSVTTGTVTRLWRYGDGNTSTQANPTKAYASAGSYTLKLISTSNFGCKDSASKSIVVFPKPSVAFTIDNDTQCFNGNHFAFNDLSSVSSGTVQRLWKLDNGDTSTTTSPEKIFALAGLFTIRLIQESDWGCKDSLSKTILVNPSQTVDFTINNDTQCLNGNSFVFNDLSTVGAGTLTRNWTFGDGNSSTQTNPTRSYSTDGTFTVEMISTTNKGCKDSLSKSITIYPKPVISFTIDNDTQCFAGNAFAFNDLSSVGSGILQRLWHFGNGDTSTSNNPSKTFAFASLYTVKLVQETDLGCKDSLSKNVLVNPTQTIDFSINNDSQCVNGNSFVFTDLSSVSAGTLQRTWRFGDGTTSAQLSPVKSHASAGTYNVTLVSTTNMGCTDSVVKTIVVHPKPTVAFTIDNDSQCFASNSFSFNDISSLSSGTMQRTWNLGNNDTSTIANPVKSFSSAGLFSVKLLLETDLGCKDSLSRNVLVNPEPIVDFAISNDSQCFAGNGFVFSDLSMVSSGTVSRNWYFGNGSQATSVNSTQAYASAGTYTVKMVSLTNKGCTDSVSKNVTVHPQPVVDFLINNNMQCLSGNSFTFTDLSVVSSGTFHRIWQFGDGDTSSVSAPQKSFALAAGYSIKLITTTDFGCVDSITKNITVHPQPAADFSISNDSQCLSGNSFVFNDLSTVATGSLERLWNLGEGDTSSIPGVTKGYTAAGTFDVKMISVTNMGCSDSVTKMIVVHPEPVVDFSISNSAQCLSGNSFVFADLSTVLAGSLDRSWSFGDGNTGAAINPSISYAAAGSYDVKMISTTGMGCSDSIIKSLMVHPQPMVDFTIDNDSQCLSGNNFTFNDLSAVSSGSIGRIWRFGDSDTSSAINPGKSYLSAGSFETKIIVTTDMGCQDSVSKTLAVHPQPAVDFSINTNGQCLSGNSFVFNDLSTVTSGTLTRNWSFGDTDGSADLSPVKIYASAGAFDVKMVSATDMGCLDSVSKTITVYPQPQVDFTIDTDSQCLAGNAFMLTDISTLTTGSLQRMWTFGDGDTSSAADPVKSYLADGSFDVKIISMTDLGCSDSVSKPIVVHPQPVVVFTANDSVQCFAQNQFEFSDVSTVNTGSLTRSWNFGDGNTSTDTDPSNSYATANSYTVNLTSYTDMGCTDSIATTIVVNPQSTVDFIINDDMQCFAGNSFVFNNASAVSTGTLSNLWHFGDSDTSSATDPSKTYSTADSYTITLITTTDKGCIDSVAHAVVVYPQPAVDFSINNDSQCFAGNTFSFADISTVASGIIALHAWDFGDGDTGTTSGSSKTYAVANIYPVMLVSTTDNGCTNTITKNIVVHPQSSAAYTISNDSQCFAGNSFVLNDLSTISSGEMHRMWFFGDGDTSTAETPAKTFLSAGIFETRLIINTGFGCKDTLQKTVVVHPQPAAAFTISNDSQCITGNGFAFADNGIITEGPLTRTWVFGDNGISTDSTPVHSYAAAGSFEVTLTNISRFGCHDSITKSVVVHALPSIQLTGPNNGIICQGSSFTLNAISPEATQYVWKRDGTVLPNASGSTFTNDSTGLYSVVVSDMYTCSNSASSSVVFSENTTAQSICLVTVDSATGKNTLVWERMNKPAQVAYLIYKETSISNIYNLIGTVSSDSLGLFIDTTSAPNAKADRYKISTLDTCGNESTKSAAHKTMHLNINAGLGNSWNLIWESYEGNTSNTINIYRGTTPANLTLLTSVQGSINSYSDLAPPTGTVYYMVTVDFGTSCDPSVLHKTVYSTTQSNIVSHIATGIAEAASIGNINVYPNPSVTGMFTLNNENNRSLSVKLFDATGKLVDAMNSLVSRNTLLDYSSLKDGIYLLQVHSENGVQHIRLVIAK
jgi:PKD repeat protein